MLGIAVDALLSQTTSTRSTSREPSVLWDSSAILAWVDADDANYQRDEPSPGSWLLAGELSVVRVRPEEEQRAKEILILQRQGLS